MRAHESQQHRWGIALGFVLMVSCNEAGDRFADSTAGAIADSAAAMPSAPSARAPSGLSATVGAPDSATEMNADAMRTGAAGTTAIVRTPPADSNHAFLRSMTDHRHGLVVLVDNAIELLDAARADADTVRQKQRRGRDDLMQILNSEYDDPITPTVVPSNRSMIDGVVGATASAADRAFYQQTIAHHRAGVATINRFLPFLSGKSKSLATTMRAEEQREIAAFERKASGSR